MAPSGATSPAWDANGIQRTSGDSASWRPPLPPVSTSPPPPPSDSAVEALLSQAAQAHAEEVKALQVTIFKLRVALSSARSPAPDSGEGSMPPPICPPPCEPPLLQEKGQPAKPTAHVDEKSAGISNKAPSRESSPGFSEDSQEETKQAHDEAADAAAEQARKMPLPGMPDRSEEAHANASASTEADSTQQTKEAPREGGVNAQAPTLLPIALAGSSDMAQPIISSQPSQPLVPERAALTAAEQHEAIHRVSSRRSLHFEDDQEALAVKESSADLSPTMQLKDRAGSHSPSASFTREADGSGRATSKVPAHRHRASLDYQQDASPIGALRGSHRRNSSESMASPSSPDSAGVRKSKREDDDFGLPQRRVSETPAEREKRRSTMSLGFLGEEEDFRKSHSKNSLSEVSAYEEAILTLAKSATGISMMGGGGGTASGPQLRREWLQGAGMDRVRSLHFAKTHGSLHHTKLQGEAANHEKVQVIQYNGFMGRLILKPDRTERIVWELIGSMFIAYDLVVVPLSLVFSPPDGWFVFLMDYLSLCFWTINIPATFLVGVVKDGVLIMVPSKIAWNYLKTWLLVDLFVVVPDWVFTFLRQFWGDGQGVDGDFVKLLRMLRLTRTLRLLRLLKLKWILEVLNDMLETEYMSIVAVIVKKLFMLVFICHYIACTWFLISDMKGGNDTWIRVYNFEDKDWFNQYVTSFHWALTQFTPASMHVNAENVYERTFNVFIVIFALVGFSYVVGSISASLAQLRALKEDVEKQFWSVRKYLRQNDVPKHLSIRIVRYLEKEHDRQKTRMSESNIKIFGLLSEQLLSEMKCAVCIPNLIFHPLFEFLNKTSEPMMQRLALKGISQKLLATQDSLFVPEEKALHMGVIIVGCLKYSKPMRGESYEELIDKEEDWIAEQALWCESWRYLGMCSAVTDCELQNVQIETFVELACNFPSVRMLIATYARSYLRMMWEMDDEDLLDISKREDVFFIARDCINDYLHDVGDQHVEPDESDVVKKEKFSLLKKVRALSTGRLEGWYTHNYVR